MNSIIKTTNLSKTYQMGNMEVQALKGIDIDIKKGEFVGITGPSGSGKSTLLNLLGCLDTPTGGEYILDGVKISKEKNLARIRREKIGFVFQSYNLLPRVSALENVEIPMIYKGLSETKRRERAKKLLESVGLEKRTEHKPTELSGGQQQRVAIARALANEPSIILADEPTGNLDTKTGDAIIDILEELNRQGNTIIMISHELNLAEQANRVIKLVDGKIAERKNL